MDYETEDKAALCRATFNLAREDAERIGATTAGTYGGRVQLSELLSGVMPWARDGWTFEPGDPFNKADGRIGAIVERGSEYSASFPVYP